MTLTQAKIKVLYLEIMNKMQNPSAVETLPNAANATRESNQKASDLPDEEIRSSGQPVNEKNIGAFKKLEPEARAAENESPPDMPKFYETELFAQTPASDETEAPTEEKIIIEPPQKPQNKAARRALSLTISALVVVLTLVFGYRLLYAPKTSAETTTAKSDASNGGAAISLSPEQTHNIAVEVVQKRFVAGEVKSPGKVAFNSNQISPVLPQFAGRLVKLTAEVGNTVRAGEVLGMIETPDIVQPQADYQQALANKRTVETTLEHAAHTRERDERLAKVEAIPLREFQDAQTDEKHAREDLGRAEQAINAAHSKLQSLHFSDADIKTLEAGGKVLNREVPLVAPIGGTITDRKAGLGQIVQPGSDALFQIANLSNVWVNAEVYEDQLAKLRVGLPVSVETAAYPGARFTARVEQIGSTVDPDKHTVAVRGVLPNPAGKLKPGMFVTVSLGGVSNLEAVTVPATAIVTEGDKRAVFIETAPNHYEKREIAVGDEQEGAVIVKSGLKEGERVVTKGSLLVAVAGN
jgi:membrane fusion protein, heavy metal efflux system